MRLLESGTHEGFKGAVHVVMGVGAVLCAAYNLGAFIQRREPHNAVNATVYSALIVLEWMHARHHWFDNRAGNTRPRAWSADVDASGTPLFV